MTRITQQSRVASMGADLRLVNSRLMSIQRQVASGRQVERPSDSPPLTLESLRYRRSLRSYGQYDRNLGDAKNWLGTADTALQSVDSRLSRVQALTVQADNASLSPLARLAIAVELRTIADVLIDIANTDHLGRPIFGGTTGGADAYDANGTYLGDAGTVERTVSSGTTVQVNVTGPDLFGVEDPGDPATGNLFELVRSIADDIEAGVSVAGSLDDLSAMHSRVHTAQATLGSRLGMVERIEARNMDTTLELKTSLSRAEDVDLTDAILGLKAQEAAYTAALSASGRILDHSLLDFLR